MEEITEKEEKDVALTSAHEVPPVPIQTYRWEEVRREKQRGGYPWTHIVKPPFDPDEPQEIIDLKQSPGRRRRKRRIGSLSIEELEESPKGARRISERSDDEEAINYEGEENEMDTEKLQENIVDEEISKTSSVKDNGDLEEQTKVKTVAFEEIDLGPGPSFIEDRELYPEVEDSEKLTVTPVVDVKASPKSILKRVHPEKIPIPENQNNSKDSDDSPKNINCCHPFVDKLKDMADKKLIIPGKEAAAKFSPKRSPKLASKKIDPVEDTKILKLKSSPKKDRKEISSFVEASIDDESQQEILDLDESPGIERRKREQMLKEQEERQAKSKVEVEETPKVAPVKSPRKRKEHIYESIEDIPRKSPNLSEDDNVLAAISHDLKRTEQIKEVLEDPILDQIIGHDSIKSSLEEDLKDELMGDGAKDIGLQEIIDKIAQDEKLKLVAPLTTMDSLSSEEDTKNFESMPTVPEESDVANTEGEDLKTDDIEIFEIIEETTIDEVELKVEEDKLKEISEKNTTVDKSLDPETLKVDSPIEINSDHSENENQNEIDAEAAIDEAIAEKDSENIKYEKKTKAIKVEEEKAEIKPETIAADAVEMDIDLGTNVDDDLPEADKKVTFSENAAKDESDLAASKERWSNLRWRSSSVGSAPRQNPLERSRAESTVSVAPEVRCACQFFQSDSLLPDRINPVGSRPSSRAEMASRVDSRGEIASRYDSRPQSRFEQDKEEIVYKNGRGVIVGDHEYEPIGQPPPNVYVSEHAEIQEEVHRRNSDVSSTTSADRKQLRINTESEAAPSDNDGLHDKNTEDELSVAEMQKQLEDRYFSTPTTTESRTDCEINTSQVDSSGLEDLPLKRGSRKKGMSASEHGRNLQQKLRSQAGRLRTKLKNIKKPEFKMPERPKFNLPERPKFTKSEKSKPEKPKPEKPASEKSRFSFPERPKFSMPERPKFSLPERAKINFPSISLPRRRAAKEKPPQSSSESTTTPKKNMFDFDFRTYPRIFDKSRKTKTDYVTSSPKDERAGTPPPEFATVPRVSRKKGPVGARWVNRFSDIKFVDDESKHSQQKLDTDDEEQDDYREGLNRSSSLERRMRNDIESRKHRDFQDRIMQIDEDYKQMQEYDQENREIHELSRQKSDEKSWEESEEHVAQTRKPKDESWHRQDSNLSEEYSGQPNEYWGAPAGPPLNDKNNFNYGVHIRDTPEMNEEREATPLTNQEEHSSGTSSERHRQGVLEEIDADEFFLRQKGISQDNIEVGKYLSSEIRDAFRTPVNALAQMDRFDDYYDRDIDLSNEQVNDNSTSDVPETPDRPERSLRRKHKRNEELEVPDEVLENIYIEEKENVPHVNGYYNTFPPERPKRNKKAKKHTPEMEEYDKEISPYNIIVDQYDVDNRNILNYEQNIDNFDRFMYENEVMEGISQPEIFVSNEEAKQNEKNKYYENDIEDIKLSILPNNNLYENEELIEDFQIEEQQPPPKAPKRRKKSFRDISASEQGSLFNGHYRDEWADLQQLPAEVDDEIIVHRVQHEYVIPLAESEQFPTPTPPRRTRSRSQISRTTSVADDDRTSHGAESLVSDVNAPFEEPRCVLDIRDGSGYAIVKKEPPPRPPAPLRRKRSTKSITDRQFNTVPRSTKEQSPVRPLRNYSTLGPSRPPRKKSSGSLHDLTSSKRSLEPSEGTLDNTQYEELEEQDQDIDSHKDLQSGAVINKMKGRPLPPPPRPPRGPKRSKDEKQIDDGGTDHFIDSTTTEISTYKEEIQQTVPTYTEATLNTSLSHPSLQEDVIEIEVSTQTDPLPDDFCCEEIEITDDMKIISPSKSRTSIHDEPDKIEKSEYRADLERARQIADAESLSRGLQRFRETSRHRNGSQGSRASRPKTPSDRAMSPTALLIERTISTPTKVNDNDEVITQVSLTVRPLDDAHSEFDDIPIIPPLPKTTEKPKLPPKESKVIPQEIDSSPTQKEVVSEKLESAASEIKTEVLEDLNPPRQEVSPQQETPKQQISATPAEPPAVSTIQPTQPEIVTRIIERHIPVPVLPAAGSEVEVLRTQRLQVACLDVDTLNVSQLQANSISVSEIEGMALQVRELNSKSGNLVVSGIELAPGVIQEIIDKLTPIVQPPPPPPPPELRPTSPVSTQTDKEEEPKVESQKVQEPPPVPPLPVMSPAQSVPFPTAEPPTHFPQGFIPPSVSGYYPYSASIPPAAFYALRPPRDYSDDELPTTHRRRRHAPRRDSTSDEDGRTEQVTRYRRHGTRSPEPSVVEISGQLARACYNSLNRTVRQLFYSITSKASGEDNKREFQMALVILLVLIAGLIMVGFGGAKNVHHHHWEFFNPPDGSG